MGELMFKYTVSPEFGYELMFKYLYNKSIEHSFAYQRYITLSDASVFNNPVAITKVATGFIDLYGLFVDKNAHPILYRNQLVETQSQTNFGQSQLSANRFLFRPDGEFNRSLSEVFLERPELVLNSQDILFGQYRKGMLIDNSGFGMFNDNDKFNILPNPKGGEKSWEFIPWTEILMGNRGGIIANHYQQYAMWRDDWFIEITYQNMMSWRDRLGFNILPMFFGSTDDKIGNHNPILMGKRDRYGFNILPIFNSKRTPPYYDVTMFTNNIVYKTSPIVNHYENIYITPSSKSIRLNQINAISTDIKHSNYMKNQDMISVPSNKSLNVFSIHNLYYETRIGNIINTITGSKTGYHGRTNQWTSAVIGKRYGSIMEQTTAYTYGRSGGYLDLEDFCIKQEQYLGLADNVSTTITHKNVFDIHEASVLLNYRTLEYTPSDAFIDTIIKNAFVSDNTKMVTKLQHDGKYNSFNVFVSLYLKPMHNRYDEAFVHNQQHEMFVQDTEIFMYRIAKNINQIHTRIFADKDKMDMFIADNGTFIHKLAKDLHTSDDNTFQNTWSIKNRLDIGTNKNKTWIYKVPKNFHDLIDNIFIGKLSFSMNISDTFIGLQKSVKDVRIFQVGVDTLKSRIIAKYDDDFNSLIKGCHDINFFDTGQYRGLMIPVSKLRHQAYIDRIDEMVSKVYKDVMITQGSFASIISTSIATKGIGNVLSDLFCDKNAHQVFIDYKNIFITKEIVRASIFKDEFVSKLSKEITIYQDSNFTCKIPKEVWISDTLPIISKEQKDVSIYKDIGLLKHPHNFNIHDYMFIDKEERICYYNYGQWVEKMKYSAAMQQQDIVHQKQRNAHIIDLTVAIEPQVKSLYINKIYHAEIIKNTNLYQQIEEIHHMYYHCGIRPEDFGNWAWIYEEVPDPFEKDPFGIDELLLPERDTRYEDFEDIIFDKQKMKPKNPVRKIDDTTFIAKYPHKHPLPKYNDIGIDYDASAIKLENYYGIETSIIHTVFLKYYRIWQSKLFEFSTMTMVQSVKLMLEYIYSWIMIYFPPEQIEQALRVFRLIRWYSESAIITNSQYIISYEYEDLKSKLTTGTCAIPNDIDPDENGHIANPTMYVDAVNGVIRNVPDFIGVSDAYVTFTINIKKNSTFSFSLRNTVGSVNIYIDNVLIDTVSSSQMLLSYPLNYTGKPIVIRIIKTRINNLNHMFCIGNITVTNGAFKDLSIEFDPTLKAGNKPLDEVAKKMLQYANEYDNIQEAYENVRKSNLGVSETYKKMVEYWKLHHEDKIKGKRLTIKEV